MTLDISEDDTKVGDIFLFASFFALFSINFSGKCLRD
jgi:hypothetical protein